MPHQALQQHDLAATAATAFVRDARVRASDSVLEVGPGRGAITAALLAAGARVAAIEYDSERAVGLRERFAEAITTGRLQVWCGDALDLQPALPEEWRVVANPPFQITSELLRRWLLEDLPGASPGALDLVLQREAAQRLCGSRSYGMSRLAVLCRLAGRPRLVRRLPRDVVRPPSRVDLAAWSWRRGGGAPSTADLRLVDRLLAIAFAGAHSLRAALASVATITILRRQAAMHGFDPEAHPRLVPPPAWLDLARFLQQIGRL